MAMKQVSRLRCVLAVSLVVMAAVGSQGRSVLDRVNVFMGSAGDNGQLAPAATVPFGMVSVCPDSDPRQHAGYDYEVARISGISLNRISGVGGSGCGGNVSLMPDAEGKDIRIDKSTEQAGPGYYRATLSNGVGVELTATRDMAVERFTFPAGKDKVIVLNPTASFEKIHQYHFRVLNDRTAQGGLISRNTCGRGYYHLLYRIHTDQAYSTDTLANGRVRFTFPDQPGQRTVEVRIVVAPGTPQYFANLTPEKVWATPFQALRQQAARQWEAVLGPVQVKGGSKDEQTMFYTALFRTYHSPFQVTDKDFTHYMGTDGQTYEATAHTYYSCWSLWDTYRTKFPLIMLLQPGRSRDILWSMAQLYTTGKQDWSTNYECTPTVRSEHAIATLLDAFRKGIVSEQTMRAAYPGMAAEANRLPHRSPDQCLETASDYWALAQLAGELNYDSECRLWRQRGEQMFDSIWPRHFQNIDATYTKMRGNGLYQGTRWQYRWAAPMFLDRMEAMHGRERLAEELNTFFRDSLYNQGNEPDIHVPFLFGRLGQPQKTGPLVHALMLDSIMHRYGGNDAYPAPYRGHAFKNAPRGYCPEMDEDDGAMSAWFVFASMGLYPLIVGEPVYELFSPVFDEITFRSGKAKIVIRTRGRHHPRQTLQRVTWNGRRLDAFRIAHSDLVQGGQLIFWY